MWLGQFSALSFLLRRPEAALASSVFAREPSSWKLLVMGDIDVLWSLWSDTRDPTARGLDHASKQMLRVFEQLNAHGKLVWVVGPQIRHAMPGNQPWMQLVFERCTRSEIWARARELHARVGDACEQRGIPVIDPTGAFIREDGTSHEGFFRDDDAHLLPQHSAYYVKAIEARLGVTLTIPPADPEAGPWRGSAARTKLRRQLAATQLREHVRLKLAAADLDVDLDDDADFGLLLDSLALTEVYTFALELHGIENTFAIDIREIATVRSMVDHMFAGRE
ncbi:MAG TPA: hypothetical protein VGM90_06265 [Kofleriaceae bacterium]